MDERRLPATVQEHDKATQEPNHDDIEIHALYNESIRTSSGVVEAVTFGRGTTTDEMAMSGQFIRIDRESTERVKA